jgi:spermidine synthase
MRCLFCRLSGYAALVVLSFVAAGQSKVLYEKESPYNTIVVTEDSDGLRTLQFERYGARQSVVRVGDPDHLELPYVRTVLVSLALIDEPGRVLIVGLGGGTIPSFLHRHYPGAVIDVVDIDPDVVDVAGKFFGFQQDDRLRAHVLDGRKFIETRDQPYDLIILDAFGADSIPYHLATREFLEAARRALASNGVVVGNIWGRRSNALYDSMVTTYRAVFDRVELLDVVNAENVIVLALTRPEPIREDDVVSRARVISQQKQWRFDLGAVAELGFRTEPIRTKGGRVLRDRPESKPF